MVRTTNLGYPRIGRNRELKKATEGYWKGTTSESDLMAMAGRLEAEAIDTQRAKGLALVPVNDMSFYDHVLDTACLFGAVPARFGQRGNSVDLKTYFAMARGSADAPAMEMTKWFDTNYHYIVPELEGGFRVHPEKAVAAVRHARKLGATPKAVVLGPFTFVSLAKGGAGFAHRADLLAELAPLYGRLVALLGREGAAAVQLDEPSLVSDVTEEDLRLLEATYAAIAKESGKAPIHLATYFGRLGEAYARVVALPVAAVQIDFVRDPRSLEDLARHGFPEDKNLVAGIVNGRNVWRTDLAKALATLGEIGKRVPAERLWLSPSASLLHLPHSIDLEKRLDPAIRGWLAYADDRLDEIAVLARAVNEGHAAALGRGTGAGAPGAVSPTVREALDASARTVAERAHHPLAVNPEVRSRTGALTDADFRRAPYAERDRAQRARLSLPPLPTTTIGSFPQTAELRKTRERFRKGEMTPQAYETYVRGEIEKVIRLQEEIGLDVLVHGEFERSDMVDYFAERLRGMAFIEGWVQSYGTRYVRPPLIYGDVSRPTPMTVAESRFAAGLTKKPMKGMLTGPVTILKWSFPREDLSQETIAYQLALAIRDETVDLERAGIPVIQIDEPAFREGLPLRRADRPDYLRWAVRAFRLSSSGVAPQTMIHSHMCYSEFNEIIGAIEDLDADVVSIESSRSRGELFGVFHEHGYARGIGPGVYDVHSERVPATHEMADMLRIALKSIPRDRLWVNPDCGLKTRAYPETVASLKNLVAAAKEVRGTPGPS